MSFEKIVPVILSGGSGTRLWPLSRSKYPKQFLHLVGNNTMLQETILRLEGISILTDPIIVCNIDHRFIVKEQLQQIKVDNPTILLEPAGRGTSAAITAAALYSQSKYNDAVLLILSADHMIQEIEAFHNAIDIAIIEAQKEKLVIFGVTPDSPKINYGYIKFSALKSQLSFEVEQFTEKPDLETAKRFVTEGNYLWNSGMFVFSPKTLINEMKIYSNDTVQAVFESLKLSKNDLGFIFLDEQSFKLSPKNSIDYDLMEKSNKVVVIPIEVKWNDVGSFSELYNIGKKDHNGNVLEGDVFVKEVSNSYIKTENRIVSIIGVDDIVVVDTDDALLISDKGKAEEVKNMVEMLQKKKRKELLNSRKVYRPWGGYIVIESGESFQVKRLFVNPGAKLSLQMHYKRAEHWVVVSGKATVTSNDNVQDLSEGDSIYIPIETKHSLENKTNKIVEIIEVQSGSYLGEDDIVRFEDLYGRL